MTTGQMIGNRASPIQTKR